jgi:hypothetical protein
MSESTSKHPSARMLLRRIVLILLEVMRVNRQTELDSTFKHTTVPVLYPTRNGERQRSRSALLVAELLNISKGIQKEGWINLRLCV